jgi:hypothetical protein
MGLPINGVVNAAGEVCINTKDLLLYLNEPKNKDLTREKICLVIEAFTKGMLKKKS